MSEDPEKSKESKDLNKDLSKDDENKIYNKKPKNEPEFTENSKSKNKESTNKESKNKESTDKQDPERNQIEEGMSNADSEESSELIYQKKKPQIFAVSFWNFDIYLHKHFRGVPIAIRYFIECFVVALILLGPLMIYNYFYEKEIDFLEIKGPAKETAEDSLFRRNMLFTILFCIYFFLYVLGDLLVPVASKILLYFEVIDSLATWAILQSIYRTRFFWIKAILFFSAFELSNYMYDPFSRTGFKLIPDENVIKTFILWFAILNGMVFLTKFIIDILTYKLRLSSYRDQVRELNYKTFIFLKLKKISDLSAPNVSEASNVSEIDLDSESTYIYIDSADEIAKTFLPPYDPGFYLTNKLFMPSQDDAVVIANNIMYLLQKKHLEFSDIEKYFPENSEKVFEFLSGSSDKEGKIKPKRLIQVSEDLYKKRKDVAATLRDRDGIFVDLEMIFVFLTYYTGVLVLLFLFKIDYKFFTASIGGFLFSFMWVFQDSIKNIYNCFLFLLIIRPFNIGDIVQIELFDYVVYKMELFESVFLNEGNILTYIPNTKLININIKNFSRSPPRSEVIEIAVDPATTYAEAQQVEKNLNSEIEKEESIFYKAELFRTEKENITFKLFYKSIDINIESIRTKRDKSIELCLKCLKGVKHFNSFVFKE